MRHKGVFAKYISLCMKVYMLGLFVTYLHMYFLDFAIAPVSPLYNTVSEHNFKAHLCTRI